ncbi:tRNA epoxyqueuosine(34) reductase QueG [Thalassotalea profundi]|uniref:Epoxyqueuosine reductase n=1 Tax=Thalassotalea profundi TaxID=2036687 RepID=A0ABQ3J4A5_9GAMM|nr:tRNA epoxyqueuosine(34) reductase QueG [Thalassotalea profundi]GHF02197.1 epoxyqueuosine reductase [Thalassotalea profundi]
MTTPSFDYLELANRIKLWGKDLGFNKVGITNVNLSDHEDNLTKWLANNYHGDMHYMESHGLMRARPAELAPGALRVISVRLDYLPSDARFAQTLQDKDKAYVSRYALGRDYHKLMRKRLKKLGEQIKDYCANLNYRPFVDSAPILERPLAEKAGLGWVGKHSLLLSQEAGSWFFIGELLVDIPLPCDQPVSENCGKCVACIKICPTNAIVEPYVVDARRCISYLTIELKDAIPLEFRSLLGNRIYGCDDCQLICPWNQYAQLSVEQDFQARHKLDRTSLLKLFLWSEQDFLNNTQGSPIRRIGYQQWLRNISVALGNADYRQEIVDALQQQREIASPLVQEHIDWALEQQSKKQKVITLTGNERLNARLIRSIEKGLPRDA